MVLFTVLKCNHTNVFGSLNLSLQGLMSEAVNL